MSNSNIDDILAALANYVVESIHLQPTPVEMIKLNQRQAKQAIQQLLDEAYKKGYIDGGIGIINEQN